MTAETIGLVSGCLVVLSAIPYSIRTYQGKIRPNITGWSLWSVIGLALLVTYKSSGAQANIWPAIFGFINPTLITLLAIKRKNKWEPLTRLEKACLAIGIVSIVMWFFMRNSPNLVQYALYVAILADSCAGIPTVQFVWTEPHGDRPFAWILFAIGYVLAIFAVTDHKTSNYVLPIYMFLAALCIAMPLALYRIKNKAELTEWI